MIQSNHHPDRDRRASKTYATIVMGVTDNMEGLRAAFVQWPSWRLGVRREKRGRNVETAVPLVVQTKRGSHDVRDKRNIPCFRCTKQVAVSPYTRSGDRRHKGRTSIDRYE